MRKFLCYLPLLACILTSCQDVYELDTAAAEIENVAVAGYPVQVNIDKAANRVEVVLPSEVQSMDGIKPQLDLSDGASATLLESKNQNTFYYKVISADGASEKRWEISFTNNRQALHYGLGHFVNAAVSLEGVSQSDFYLPQENSGVDAQQNCGPAVAAMALKWVNPASEVSVAQLRNEIPVSRVSNEKPWYPKDVYTALQSHGVKVDYWYFAASATESFITRLCEQLTAGKLAIVCLNAGDLTAGNSDNQLHTNRYYDLNKGHYLLVKGFRVVDGNVWFEVHDPWSAGKKYSDGSYKGANRYYAATDVAKSLNWNQWVVFVSRNASAMAA